MDQNVMAPIPLGTELVDPVYLDALMVIRESRVILVRIIKGKKFIITDRYVCNMIWEKSHVESEPKFTR